MSKKSDDSIERIFRQALTHYDTTFRESDWLKMEKMLDAEAVRMALVRSKRIKGIGLALTGLTVLFIAVYFLAFNPSDSAAQLDHPATETQAGDELSNNGNVETENSSNGLLSTVDSVRLQSGKEKRSQMESSPAFNDTSERLSNVPKNNMLRLEHTQKSEKKEDVTRKGLAKQTPDQSMKKDLKGLQTDATPGKKGRDGSVANEGPSDRDLDPATTNNVDIDRKEIESIQELKANERSNQSINNIQKDPSDNDNLANRKDIGKDEKNEKENVNRTQAVDSLKRNSSEHGITQYLLAEDLGKQKSSETKGDSIVGNEVAKKLDKPDSVPQDFSPEELSKEKTKPESRWSIGIVFTPEFSTTRLSHYSAPGESVGLRIGYQISDRLHVNTGIIRSNKRYKDSGSEYSPNPNYWNARTNGVIPDEIDGKCLVYEIPLGLQYDVISREKSRVFLSTAISNYIMVSQSYDYRFDQPNPGADTNWNTSRTDKYWFGVGVFSVGYEHYLSRSVALGIEPYLKTSFTEIGWPNVKLFSAGAYITLRYRFMTKEKQIK